MEETLNRIEQRLTRIEATMAQSAGPAAGAGAFVPPGGTVVDPAPWGGGGGGWTAPWVRPRPWPWPSPVVDPAPWGGGGGGGWGGPGPVISQPIGTIGDPPPLDLSRFTLEQLETSLHNIAAERSRLDATEQMINKRIETLKAQQG